MRLVKGSIFGHRVAQWNLLSTGLACLDSQVKKPCGNVRKRLSFHASFVTLSPCHRWTEATVAGKFCHSDMLCRRLQAVGIQKSMGAGPCEGNRALQRQSIMLMCMRSPDPRVFGIE